MSVRSLGFLFGIGLAVVACGSQDRIKSACEKSGGIKLSKNRTLTSSQVEASCACFSKQLGDSIPPEELKVLAENLERSGGASENMGLTMDSQFKVMGAAKSCAIS